MNRIAARLLAVFLLLTIAGPAAELLTDERVRRAYLG